jgi:hypothetical protein
MEQRRQFVEDLVGNRLGKNRMADGSRVIENKFRLPGT